MTTPHSQPNSARHLPPGPKVTYPGQHVLSLIRSPLHFLEQAAAYGDIVRLSAGAQGTYLFNSPDDVRDVLVTNHRLFTKSPVLHRMGAFLGQGLLTSEDDLHLRQRRLIQPAFHRQRVQQYGQIMVQYALQAGARWQNGETRDIHAEMMRLTMVVVGQALFGTNVEEEAAEIGQAITILLAGSRRLLLPFWDTIQNWPIPSNRRILKAGQIVDQAIRRMIAERRSTTERGHADQHLDLLDMLLQARDVEGDGRGMSDALIRDEALTLFLAGHETTANTLTWTWYLLSQHPQVEAQFYEELDRVLGGRIPEPEDAERLPYTCMVLSESMRLFPPSWTISRQAQADYAAGGYTFPKGSVIMLSQWVMHHDARFYPDPWRFDPHRWTAEAVTARPKFSYFPFGGGPRMCIGEPFAWMEGILILATLAQQWRLRLDPAQKVEPLPQVTLRPKYGMRMRLERRNHG